MNLHELIPRLIFWVITGFLGRWSGPVSDWIVKEAARRRVPPEHAVRWERQWLADLHGLPGWLRLLSAVDIFFRGSKLYGRSTVSSPIKVSKGKAASREGIVYASLLTEPPPYEAPITIVDALTGLFNRRAFDERLDVALERAQLNELPLSVIMIDIDHFKRINCHYGHSVGDGVLKGIAKTLGHSLRGVGFVARCGDDEFVVAVPDASRAAAVTIAERILADIESTPISSGDLRFVVTASIGVTTCATFLSGLSEHELPNYAIFSKADAALQEAKNAGRSCVRVSPSDG